MELISKVCSSCIHTVIYKEERTLFDSFSLVMKLGDLSISNAVLGIMCVFCKKGI